jgi:small multidrug resistance pump
VRVPALVTSAIRRRVIIVSYIYLSIAIIAEVIGTSALKATEEFTRLGPSLIVVAGYGVAFFLLTLALRTIPVGIAYAIWSGVGVAFVAGIAALLYQQVPDAAAILGMSLIVSGVIVINLFSQTAGH